MYDLVCSEKSTLDMFCGFFRRKLHSKLDELELDLDQETGLTPEYKLFVYAKFVRYRNVLL